ncbi:MAG: prolyl oligopeptidase family serine peptidase [Pseudomonadota bacterium]
MHTQKILIALAAVALSGCGPGKPAPRTPVVPDAPTTASRGTLLGPVQKVSSLHGESLAAKTREFGGWGAFVAGIASPSPCGVDLYYFKYSTVGAANESTTATGAIMVPGGTAEKCGGARPVMLYAHGNTRRQDANMADMRPDAPLGYESYQQAMMYAAAGYIVVAPNYAGHDTSSLGYHPHHIADQQSKDMIDALSAARSAFAGLAASDNGKLFLTGFSEGGYATMATHRAMQAAGIAVTASAPQAGNFAEAAMYEALLASTSSLADMSKPDFEAMVRFVVKITGWQKAYGNIYSNPSELYPAAYADKMETMFPSVLRPSELKPKMPGFLLPNDMPGVSGLSVQQQLSFGPPENSLFKSSYLARLMADKAAIPCDANAADAPLACGATHPMRLAWFKNDLRTWVPRQPMLMCGGNRDPVVSFQNTRLTDAYFKAHGVRPGVVTVVDVDSAIGENDFYGPAKRTFQRVEMDYITDTGMTNVTSDYHGSFAFLACSQAARDYFKQF